MTITEYVFNWRRADGQFNIKANISQDSVCKFTAERTSEEILRIGQHSEDMDKRMHG